MKDIKSESVRHSRAKKFSWRKTFDLIKDYFVHSDEKLVAWFLLIGIILCVIGLVALSAAFAWWSAGFWAILAAKNVTPFLVSMGYFTLLVSATVGLYSLKNYLTGKLSVLWRHWFTNKILNQLFTSENNYLDLKRFSTEIKNISQRIQEDVKNFVRLSISLSMDFLKSILSLVTFTGTLWVVGGALSFVALGLNIVIPGYLVWGALILAIAGTVTTHYIGRSLLETNKNAEDVEADLRQELAILNNDAENIAEEHAEEYFQKSLANKIQNIKENANEKIKTQSKLDAFKNFYTQVSGILPNVLSAPLYFSGLIELGQLMQIGVSFYEVNSALSWLVDAYENLSKYETNIERITELQYSLEQNGLDSNPKSIVRKEKNKDSVSIKHLNIASPQTSSTSYIMRNLNLQLKPGEHILIKGKSGLGKSTVFKAISGTWKYGDGTITVPKGKRMYFLPQRPTLPIDTLKAVLAYPDRVDSYTEDQYKAALLAVGEMEQFIPLLRSHEKRNWYDVASGGQQQRISFARALLKKPDWLFLDEATSALDEKSELCIYSKIIEELKDSTIVSIAHRHTVEKFHSRIVYLGKNDKEEIEVSHHEPALAI